MFGVRNNEMMKEEHSQICISRTDFVEIDTLLLCSRIFISSTTSKRGGLLFQ